MNQLNDKLEGEVIDVVEDVDMSNSPDNFNDVNKNDAVIEDSLYNKLVNLAETKPKNKSRKRLKLNFKKGTKQRTSKIKRKS